jgi:hypothetical protein
LTFLFGICSCLGISLVPEPVNFCGSAFVFPCSIFSFGSDTFAEQAKGAAFLPSTSKAYSEYKIKLEHRDMKIRASMYSGTDSHTSDTAKEHHNLADRKHIWNRGSMKLGIEHYTFGAGTWFV